MKKFIPSWPGTFAWYAKSVGGKRDIVRLVLTGWYMESGVGIPVIADGKGLNLRLDFDDVAPDRLSFIGVQYQGDPDPTAEHALPHWERLEAACE